MGLIKSANVPAAAATFSMRDIENHAKSILLRARQQAEALLVEAQQEAEALRVQANAEGREQGRREGLAQGKQEGARAGAAQALAEHKAQLTAAFTALAAAAAQLDASRRELEADGLKEVVTLATAIARRVTKRQGLIEPAVLAANLNEAMKLVAHAADVRVAVHPAQKKVLDETLPALRLAWPGLRHVEMTGDPAVAPGGCRIFTARGHVDADLDAQLDRVVADLLPSGGEGAAS
jgi:flagellar biosynthesis/type III secretory pathway protein FliH